jgi:hypothetical protein
MTRHHVESGERRPDMNRNALMVTGSPAGAILDYLAAGNGIAGIPEARPFLLASGGLGIPFGSILCWKHR